MDTYCWIHSTFSLPKLINAEVGGEISNPGVGPVINEDEVVEHKYYQWVCFTLFLQVLFLVLTDQLIPGFPNDNCRVAPSFCPTHSGKAGKVGSWPPWFLRRISCTGFTTLECQGLSPL